MKITFGGSLLAATLLLWPTTFGLPVQLTSDIQSTTHDANSTVHLVPGIGYQGVDAQPPQSEVGQSSGEDPVAGPETPETPVQHPDLIEPQHNPPQGGEGVAPPVEQPEGPGSEGDTGPQTSPHSPYEPGRPAHPPVDDGPIRQPVDEEPGLPPQPVHDDPPVDDGPIRQPIDEEPGLPPQPVGDEPPSVPASPPSPPSPPQQPHTPPEPHLDPDAGDLVDSPLTPIDEPAPVSAPNSRPPSPAQPPAEPPKTPVEPEEVPEVERPLEQGPRPIEPPQIPPQAPAEPVEPVKEPASVPEVELVKVQAPEPIEPPQAPAKPVEPVKEPESVPEVEPVKEQAPKPIDQPQTPPQPPPEPVQPVQNTGKAPVVEPAKEQASEPEEEAHPQPRPRPGDKKPFVPSQPKPEPAKVQPPKSNDAPPKAGDVYKGPQGTHLKFAPRHRGDVWDSNPMISQRAKDYVAQGRVPFDVVDAQGRPADVTWLKWNEVTRVEADWNNETGDKTFDKKPPSDQAPPGQVNTKDTPAGAPSMEDAFGSDQRAPRPTPGPSSTNPFANYPGGEGNSPFRGFDEAATMSLSMPAIPTPTWKPRTQWDDVQFLPPLAA